MPRNSGGSTKAGQIYQPPIQKHRKEVGDNLRKRSHKPMVKQLKAQEKVKVVRDNVSSAGYWLLVFLVFIFVMLYVVFNFLMEHGE